MYLLNPSSLCFPFEYASESPVNNTVSWVVCIKIHRDPGVCPGVCTILKPGAGSHSPKPTYKSYAQFIKQVVVVTVMITQGFYVVYSTRLLLQCIIV